MRRKAKSHVFGTVLALVLMLGAFFVVFSPWNNHIENWIKSAAKAKGFQDVTLNVSSFGLDGIVVDNISIGGKTPFALKKLNLIYSLSDIEGRNKKNAKWAGKWQAEEFESKGSSYKLPVMSGAGDFFVTAERLILSGILKSVDQSNKANFRVDYFFNEQEKSVFTIVEAVMPWNGGVLSTRDVKIPLSGEKDLKIILDVKRVSVDSFLRQLTGTQASATGAVSGVIPLVVKADGTFALEDMKLLSDGAGTIVMSPEAIPGDNEQVSMVRDIMKNLHYSVMSVTTDNDANGKLSVHMNIEGNNPDIYEGRPVKLNVNLTGDVLNLVQQNLTALTNPHKLLEQDENAKK